MKNILHRENIKLVYVLGMFAFAFFLLAYIANLLLSAVLAFVFFYLMSPIVSFCERRGLPRGASIFVIYSLFAILVITTFAIFLPQVIDQAGILQEELPQLQRGFVDIVQRTEARIEATLHTNRFGVVKSLGDWLVDQTTRYSSMLPRWISNSLTTLFLTPFLAFFMLRDGTRLKRKFLKLIPNAYFEMVLKLLHEMNDQIGKFIRARFLEALIVGIVTLVGLLVMGFPFAILLALFAALTNLIPYLGPIVGAVPPVIIALVNPDIVLGSLSMNLIVLAAIYMTAQILDAFVIIPVVVAKIVDLHPVTVILVIILGAQLLGILGMIISIPVASLCKLILSTFYNHLIRTSPVA